jgi:hypothetical protein
MSLKNSYVGAVDNWVCYGSAVWQGYSAVLCDTVYIGIWCVLWQCSVARLQCCVV